MRILAFAVLALAALACRSRDRSLSVSSFPDPPPPVLAPEVRADREAKLAAARAAVDRDPADLDARIWLGRREAYLGLYGKSIETFSAGLALAVSRGDLGFEARFLRHRGHRYITVRAFDSAIADLERAAALLPRVPDEIEPDGLPNARNVPTSTLHTNVTYHLGLALFLSGRFDAAADAYRACAAASANPDMLCAATHWLYMTLRRLGRAAEAARALDPIRADMDVIENRAYLGLCLAYRGEIAPESLLDEARRGGGIDFATAGFGVGHLRLVSGDRDGARSLFSEIVAAAEPAAFGFIAAEAELARD